MCDIHESDTRKMLGVKTIPVSDAVGMVLAHDITEIVQGESKGRAFKKGYIVRDEDVSRLKRLGKENLYVLNIKDDEIHEDDAAYALAEALMGEGIEMEGEPKEGKINLIANRRGLLKVDKNILTDFNMLGDVMCASLHSNTVVEKGQVVAGTRAIPLVVKRNVVEEAVAITKQSQWPGAGRQGIISVRELRKPKAGVVITGNEVYYGRIKDAFAPIIKKKIDDFGGEIIGTYYAPDDEEYIEQRLKELIEAGADLLITTGGMSVDPDDVTRFAVRKLGATDITYGSAVLPGAMFLAAYVRAAEQQNSRTAENLKNDNSLRTAVPLHDCSAAPIPILGIPACGMYHKTTIFDLIMPRVLAGEHIGRRELAELGHGGLCLNCRECRYPVCPFGK